MPTIHVTVTVTVPIDLDAWNLSYGEDEDQSRVTTIIRGEATEILAEHYRRTGVLAS